jgi:hypothetical protein
VAGCGLHLFGFAAEPVSSTAIPLSSVMQQSELLANRFPIPTLPALVVITLVPGLFKLARESSLGEPRFRRQASRHEVTSGMGQTKLGFFTS